MGDNIKKVDFKSDEASAALEILKREIGTMVEYQALLAQVHKASYDAHIAQGFTEEQALELCKTNF